MMPDGIAFVLTSSFVQRRFSTARAKEDPVDNSVEIGSSFERHVTVAEDFAALTEVTPMIPIPEVAFHVHASFASSSHARSSWRFQADGPDRS
jgi:hypothetical protein